MKYELTNKDAYFVKKDEYNMNLMLIKETGNQVFLNDMGMYILEMAGRFYDTDDLGKELKIEFPKVDKRVIEADLMELFYLMELYGIVKMERKKKVSAIDEDIIVKFSGDKEYKDLYHFIKEFEKKSEYNFSQADSIEYYEPLSMRFHTFNNQEYYLAAIKNSEIIASMSVVPSNYSNKSSVALITSFFTKDGIEKDKLILVLKRMLDRLVKPIAKNIGKIRVNEIEGQDIKALELFKTIGFEQECVLKNEFQGKDLAMYAYFL